MKRIATLVCAMLMLAALVVGCSAAPQTSEDQSGAQNEAVVTPAPSPEAEGVELPETLRVGVGSTYPWGFNEDNKLQGFVVDVWNEIGTRLGIAIEFSQYENAEGLYGAMDSGRLDVVATQVAITPAIADKYIFSDVFGHNVIKMAVRSDSEAEDITDLHGKKVCIEPGGKLAEFFNNYNANLSDEEKIELVFTEGSIWEELELGRFESFPITVLSYDARVRKGEERNIKLIGDAIITEDNVFPFRSDFDQAVLDKINETLAAMKEDGFLTETSIKWYGRDLTDQNSF